VTPDQVAAVQATMTRLGTDLEKAADDFYARLFGAHPHLRARFPDDIEVQRRKFADEIKVIVLAIPDFGRFRNRAQELGTRHRGYGVVPSEYAVVREHLLDALASADPGWDDDTASAWRSGYDLVAELMQARDV
jgi:hemoglobin-like flavoprotein